MSVPTPAWRGAPAPWRASDASALHGSPWRVALLLLAWFAASAWLRPLALPDEGRYVGVAWDMLQSGDWLTPALDGLPFFHKPPLFYWLTAASLAVFGPVEGAARVAPVLGATLGALALWGFLRRWSDAARARASTVVLATAPLFFLAAQYANLDMLVAGCISATVCLGAHAVLSAEAARPARAALAGACVAAALGVLAKGLIGAVLPALVLACWLLWRRRPRGLLQFAWPPGWALFLIVAAPWFVAMQARYPDFLDYFFVVQHFKRFAEGGFNNVRPAWFYPAVLLAGMLPWTVAVADALRRRQPAIGRPAPVAGGAAVASAEGLAADAQAAAVLLLMRIWFAVVLVFFSLPQSKLVGYVLPAVPPLAFLLADGWLAAGRPARRFGRAGAVVGGALGLVAVAVFTLRPVHSSRDLAAALVRDGGAEAPLVFLGEYYHDVPFYAARRAPVQVVDDWADPKIALRDNWRKELADAARFAPERAARTLIAPGALAGVLCSAPRTWVMAPPAAGARQPLLRVAQPVARNADAVLWRFDLAVPGAAAALGCPSGRAAPAPSAAAPPPPGA